jgi:hypothetical protein
MMELKKYIINFIILSSLALSFYFPTTVSSMERESPKRKGYNSDEEEVERSNASPKRARTEGEVTPPFQQLHQLSHIHDEDDGFFQILYPLSCGF